MASLKSVLVSGLLAASVNAQAYDSGDRSEEAFSWVQPKNTTILGQYGHSPAYPSSMYNHFQKLKLFTNIAQPTLMVRDGNRASKRPRSSSPS